MADETQTPPTLTLDDHFKEAIRTVAAGVKELTAAGLPTPDATAVAIKVLDHANQRHDIACHKAELAAGRSNRRVSEGSAGQMQQYAQPGPQRPYSNEEQKAAILDAIRREIPRLGITREELTGLFGEQRTPSRGPTGDDNDPEAPVVAQTHGPKTETASTRTDDTNPGGTGDNGEPTTGEPPHTEPNAEPQGNKEPQANAKHPKPPKPRH